MVLSSGERGRSDGGTGQICSVRKHVTAGVATWKSGMDMSVGASEGCDDQCPSGSLPCGVDDIVVLWKMLSVQDRIVNACSFHAAVGQGRVMICSTIYWPAGKPRGDCIHWDRPLRHEVIVDNHPQSRTIVAATRSESLKTCSGAGYSAFVTSHPNCDHDD
jgi:hypothetical protein